MSDQAVDKPQNDTASKPEATGMSKSAKKRANKKQKKLSESEKTNTESERPVEVTQPGTDKKKDKAEVKKPEKSNDAVDKLVPLIQRFDVNGKPLRTIAGNIPVHLGEITPHNILQLKKLNEAVFPIAYNDKFYVEARTCGDLGRLAYYNDVVVGAVCCRIDDISDEKSLYLMTLGTLAAYRQYKIMSRKISYRGKSFQVNNEKAVSFYEKHGFVNDGIIEDYYRISPRDAYLLIKRIRN
ncbi:Protein CBG14164 [Caenorhabditis briggsae]|uniref:N-terminal methionine N(alpha)-acetyltransferase NatE n=1 Tax=Caenorhabditis briggsae TaxID=6238 RepID=A8XJF5_CAEBR|nr:Protein CBG14164 [Caenorhabditis briggsae]CAP32780.2 Protein CBG14164 [Caenorhabditis briggsae]